MRNPSVANPLRTASAGGSASDRSRSQKGQAKLPPPIDHEYDAYLACTEEGTLNSFTAEELVKEFYDPKAVADVLAHYHANPLPPVLV
jgi:hypothetical protein